MEHIVQFGIGIDDEAIKNAVLAGSKKCIENDIKIGVINALFAPEYYNRKPYRKNNRDEIIVDEDARLSSYAEKILCDMLSEHKDDIINKAAEMLVESMKRTKAVKDAVNSAVERV